MDKFNNYFKNHINCFDLDKKYRRNCIDMQNEMYDLKKEIESIDHYIKNNDSCLNKDCFNLPNHIFERDNCILVRKQLCNLLDRKKEIYDYVNLFF